MRDDVCRLGLACAGRCTMSAGLPGRRFYFIYFRFSLVFLRKFIVGMRQGVWVLLGYVESYVIQYFIIISGKIVRLFSIDCVV